MKKIKEIKYLPIGTVLAITTFSSPHSSFFHKIIPAIICGNVFVFVSSPKVCKCSKKIFDLLEQTIANYLQEIKKKDIFC